MGFKGLKPLKLISSGKTKNVYSSNDPNLVLIEFRDDVTALDGRKHDVLKGKGVINAAITAKLFTFLNASGFKTHYVGMAGDSLMVAHRLNMIPVEAVCRSIATGSLVKRLPFQEGVSLPIPLVEFYLKDDARGDPMINKRHMAALGLTTLKEADLIEDITLNVNETLKGFLARRGLKLLDFKLEFGRSPNGDLTIGDELDPDCMRLRDANSGAIMDKDLYRRGHSLAEVMEAYRECYRRIVEDA
ncbi:MAG: phosphoribosylaminoimidazolesuccinocarboxamide synthase [Candidatus Nezhaarchaeales archaeon]